MQHQRANLPTTFQTNLVWVHFLWNRIENLCPLPSLLLILFLLLLCNTMTRRFHTGYINAQKCRSAYKHAFRVYVITWMHMSQGADILAQRLVTENVQPLTIRCFILKYIVKWRCIYTCATCWSYSLKHWRDTLLILRLYACRCRWITGSTVF